MHSHSHGTHENPVFSFHLNLMPTTSYLCWCRFRKTFISENKTGFGHKTLRHQTTYTRHFCTKFSWVSSDLSWVREVSRLFLDPVMPKCLVTEVSSNRFAWVTEVIWLFTGAHASLMCLIDSSYHSNNEPWCPVYIEIYECFYYQHIRFHSFYTKWICYVLLIRQVYCSIFVHFRKWIWRYSPTLKRTRIYIFSMWSRNNNIFSNGYLNSLSYFLCFKLNIMWMISILMETSFLRRQKVQRRNITRY